MPSVTRIGSNTTMSPPCSRSVSRPAITRVPTFVVSVLFQGADGSTVESSARRSGRGSDPHRPARAVGHSARR